MLTVWDFNGATESSSLVEGWGQPGYTGTTLKMDPGNGSGALGLVTFAGLSSGNATLSVGTGATGGACLSGGHPHGVTGGGLLAA